tara:strand:- start:57 stop:434 length:378 start_codon:yes stop_codon:yes gene_type:complete
MKLFSARTGKDHFVDSDKVRDWFSQVTICGRELRGSIPSKDAVEKHGVTIVQRTGVNCMNCMTKAGLVKKNRTTGTKSSPGVIGYTQTTYEVVKPFRRMEINRNLVNYLPGDLITGEAYDRARAR